MFSFTDVLREKLEAEASGLYNLSTDRESWVQMKMEEIATLLVDISMNRGGQGRDKRVDVVPVARELQRYK